MGMGKRSRSEDATDKATALPMAMVGKSEAGNAKTAARDNLEDDDDDKTEDYDPDDEKLNAIINRIDENERKRSLIVVGDIASETQRSAWVAACRKTRKLSGK